MKQLSLKVSMALTDAERAFLSGLPASAPDTKLLASDARQISNIYYRVLGTHPKSKELMDATIKVKWPGGERRSLVQAQRDVLDLLSWLRENGHELQDNPLEWLMSGITGGSGPGLILTGVALHITGHQDKPDLYDINILVNGRIVKTKAASQLDYKDFCAMAFPDMPYKLIDGKAQVEYAISASDDTVSILPNSSEYISAYPGLRVNVTLSAPGVEK